MGTDNGLCRFDGNKIKTYKRKNGLSDNKIISLSEDNLKNLWIGTFKGGVNCLTANGFKQFPGQDELRNSSIFSIKVASDGKIWFGTSLGLSYFNGKKIIHFKTVEGLKNKKLFTITFENERELWIGTDRALLCYDWKNNNSLLTYTVEDGLLGDYITALLFDSRKRLWIGTKKGLNLIKNGNISSYTLTDGLSDNIVTSLVEDQKGNIWIGTWNGVSLYQNNKFTTINTVNGLPNNFVYYVTYDTEDNVWFGTNSGAGCLTSLNIKTFNQKNGLPNDMIVDILQAKNGQYWLATTEGLCCYNNDKFKTYTIKDGLIDNAINNLLEDHSGNIWITTPQGLSIFSSGTFTNYTNNDKPSNILFDLIERINGQIWIGTRKGVTYFKNGKFLSPFPHLKGIVMTLLEDSKNQLWFSSDRTILRYSQNSLTSISKRHNLPDFDIYSIYQDQKGKIWIGTEGGIHCIYKESFTHFSSQNSKLLDDTCFTFLEDRDGRLWVGHPNGLSCFDGEKIECFSNKRLGLEERSWLSGIKNNSGELWYGTAMGITYFNPPPVKFNPIPPPVIITNVKVMEKEVPWTKNSQFKYNQNIFRFNFVGLSFSPPGVDYKYMLENIDKEWHYTKERSLFYPFLPPGSYTFKVKAINNDGYESKSAAKYQFRILSPFWRTLWFTILLGLIAVLLVVVLVHWRIKRIREKTEIQARKTELEAKNKQLIMSQRMELMATLAAGNVHDLKNLMGIIIGYSRIMSKKHQDDKEDSQNIEIINETAATAVQMAKQILSFSRAKNLSQNQKVELGQELSEIIETLKITQSKNLHIFWKQPSMPIYSHIHPVHFQQIVMNLCLNACQAMPEGGELQILLSQENNGIADTIKLEISDTGSGINEENLSDIFKPMFTTKEPGEGTGLGLFVVKQIVEEYKGNIEVFSKPGKGTSFSVQFPKETRKEN